MSLGVSLGLSLLLLVANAFFVAAEFAVVSAKRHRLQGLAARGNRSARAAVRNSRELSLALAGAQLGITLATLALGALAKPAVAGLLGPVVGALPVSDAVASAVTAVLGVAVVVFLHMVVGEMAPKSWAITHPERSALLLALPFRAFMASTRWVLNALNAIANLMLRRVGVEPVDEGGHSASVQGPVELQLLLSTSGEQGLIQPAERHLLGSVIDLAGTPLWSVTLPLADTVTIPSVGLAQDVERVSLSSGRSRLVVVEDGRPTGLVHVRDAVLSPPQHPLREVEYDALRLDQHLTLLGAIAAMRADRAQLSFVTGTDGEVVGIAALEDLLEKVLGQFEDETDLSA